MPMESAPRDIRELLDDPDAYALELRRRWGGLLSYRYIGRSYASMDLGPVDNTVTLRRDMRDPRGGILLAVLGIASPEGGGMHDREAVPNPVVHSCQVVDPGADVRRIDVVSETLRRGRQMGYSRSAVVDADAPSRVLAYTEGQGISLGAPPDGLGLMPVDPIVIDDGPGLPPLWQVFGGRRVGPGTWTLPVLSAEVASPDAALHLGSQFVVLEAAARDAAGALGAEEDLLAVSSHVMFLARGKVGPFRAVAEAAGQERETVGARVMMYDDGNGGRPITSASYLFRR